MRLSNFSVIAGVLFVFNAFSFADIDTPVVSDTTGDGVVSESSVPVSSSMDPELRLIHLSVQKPTKIPTVLENGRIVVSTVESYDVDVKRISPCSFTARNNIIHLLGAMGLPTPWLAQGNANDLIRFGRFNNTLTSFTDKNLLLEALNHRRDERVETVFDVYRFVSQRSYALQAHRVAVFLGDDEEWYILDPLDGKRIREPQLFRDYLKNDVEAEWLVRLPGYSMIDLVSQEEFNKSLPYLSRELQFFFHTYYPDAQQVSWNTPYNTQILSSFGELSRGGEG